MGKGEGDEEWIKIAVPSNAEIYSLQLGPFGAMFICDDPKCAESQKEFNNTDDARFLNAFMMASMFHYVGGNKELDKSYYERERQADEIMARHGGGASLVYDEYFHHDHKGEYVKEINDRGLWRKANVLNEEALQ